VKPLDVDLRRQQVIDEAEAAGDGKRNGDGLTRGPSSSRGKRKVDGAERETGAKRSQGANQEGVVARAETRKGGHDGPQVVETGHEQRDAEHALDRVHPWPGFRQLHGETSDGPKGNADAGGVGGEKQESVAGIAGGGDVGQDPGQRRSRARRGDEATHEAHQEGAGEASATDLRQAPMERRGKR
jgi:hypothetical protein